MSASKTPSFVFRKQLFAISNKLNNADVTNLKFLCGDVLPRRVLEGATTASDLFLALEDVDLLSSTKLDFLQLILDSVSKGHLVKDLKEALANPVSYESGEYETASSGPPSLSSTDPLVIKFNSFLVSLGMELPERDLKHAAYFFQSCKVTGLSAQEVQRLREPAQLFDILKKEKIISPTDLGQMRRVMEAIGRIDLRDKIDEYTEGVGGGGGGGRGGSKHIVLDSSGHPSLSSHFSFDSSDGKEVFNPRPVQPQLRHQPEQSNYKSGLTDSVPGRAMCEQGGGGGGGGGGQSSHLMIAGDNAHHRETPAVAMEQQAPVGQAEERVAQSVGGVVGKMVLNTGRSVNHEVDRSELPSRRHTHTQQLQLERNEAMEKVKQLENRLEHERIHHQEQQQAGRGLVEELGRKNEEVGQLRQLVQKLDGQLQRGEETEMYKMNAIPPHGKAIVIVNDSFNPNPLEPDLDLRPRRGAGRDMSLFKQTFENLGYLVEAHSNLTSIQMHQVLIQAAEKNHEEYDSFVCCISTHGDEENLYGVDSVGAKRSELIQPVKQSKTLHKKPKMFFIQSCRIRPISTPNRDNWTNYQPNAPDQDADIFVANATTPNSASFRDPLTGSWFVSTLHSVFTSRGHSLTLTALMHEVNREVCKTEGVFWEEDPRRQAAGSQEARQCIEITSSFRYGLRFKFSSQ